MFGRKKKAEESAGRVRKSLVHVGGNKRKLLDTSAHRSSQLSKGILKISSSAEAFKATYGAGNEKDGSENGTCKGIKFHLIEIREYDRALGDNPSCSSGPPISISWDYNPDVIKLSLEEYEDTRPPRRSNYEMILPRDVRQAMLRKEWGVTQSQIASAVRANIKIKNQRRTTVNNLSKSTRVEEAFENATRKVMKGLLLKNTNKELDKLEKQAKEAEEQRKKFESDELGPGVARVA